MLIMLIDKQANVRKRNKNNVRTRLAETPECWSLEFQLDATFAANFGHIGRQIVYICSRVAVPPDFRHLRVRLRPFKNKTAPAPAPAPGEL